MQTSYSKTELQKIFTEALRENPEQKPLLSGIWKKIKEIGDPMNLEFLEKRSATGDAKAAFSINTACFTYYLISQDSKTDSYWEQAVKELESIVENFGEDSLERKWGRAILKAADDICTNRT